LNVTRIASLAALCALFLSATTAHAADEVAEIVNFRDYSEVLSSSGQPNAEQLQAVSNAGFERVVFLAFSDHEHSLQHEDRIVKGHGMEYAQIPIDWEAPTKSDFYMFAGLLQRAPQKKTLVHCQVNFRASTFSFLYRVLYEDVPVAAAKEDMNSVWVPNATWRQLIFDVLEENGVAPDCDDCLGE
jgi:protein tyrosine phosphatase (PTP) superfamily phosphohydrolase (DUF442 family)